MRSELYLLGGAAIGMAAAVVLIFAQPVEAVGSASSADMKTYSVELERPVVMTAERKTEPAVTVIERTPANSPKQRDVRVILPSPYEGVSQGGVR
jgi:hypothetical protein